MDLRVNDEDRQRRRLYFQRRFAPAPSNDSQTPLWARQKLQHIDLLSLGFRKIFKNAWNPGLNQKRKICSFQLSMFDPICSNLTILYNYNYIKYIKIRYSNIYKVPVLSMLPAFGLAGHRAAGRMRLGSAQRWNGWDELWNGWCFSHQKTPGVTRRGGF